MYPEMIYGMEVLPLTKKQEQSLKEAEVRGLGLSYVVTRSDKIRNESVRKKMNLGALNCKLREARLRWKGQVARKEDNHVGKILNILNNKISSLV